jgi:hypothetical protein
MNKFFLVDYDHNKAAKRQDKLYLTAAKIALKYGEFGRRFKNCDELYIQEFWDGDDCPSFNSFRINVKVSVTKWYIHNRINISDEIWNGDFLHGLATGGDLKWKLQGFSTLTWRKNAPLFELLKASGFGGSLSHQPETGIYRWKGVPAFYLKHDDSSLSFMAGVLATGVFCKVGSQIYARYTGKQKEILNRWNIPIEDKLKNGRYLLVSPIWGALFTPKMPKERAEKWLNLERPFGRDIYPSILWKTYANNEFPTGGIPYLRSRRWIYTHYKSDIGAMKTLERERVNRNLTELDNRVRDMVHKWRK